MNKKICFEPASFCKYCGEPIGVKGFDDPNDDCCMDCLINVVKPTKASLGDENENTLHIRLARKSKHS